METFLAKHIGISIEAPAEKVYQFAVNPENLPAWASGLSGSIEKIGDEWIADSPMGRVKVKFENENRFGILDHEVDFALRRKSLQPAAGFSQQRRLRAGLHAVPFSKRIG